MGYSCDFCGKQRSMIYCLADATRLCLSCDRNLHSVDTLSELHLRTLICPQCNTEPVSVRCVEEKHYLCQNCNWLSHGPSTSASTHKRQLINCYSGCPAAAELASIWSFPFDNADTNVVAGDSEEMNFQNNEKLIPNLDQLPESSKESPETCEVRNEDTIMDDEDTKNYQDCRISSAIPMGEPPWSSPHPDVSFQLQSTDRTEALNRYKQKKKGRDYKKKVRYPCRKERADTRRRHKGRFVKDGEASDNDPLSDPDIHSVSVKDPAIRQRRRSL